MTPIRGLLRTVTLVFVIMQIHVPALAKTVVCIDAGDDFRFVEGYYRQILEATDVIQVGGSLADCYCNVEEGDTLIILGHGVAGGGAFNWGGTTYGGFKRAGSEENGTGVNGDPFELTAKEFANISAHLWFCWADVDPEGETTTPTTDSLDDIIDHGDGSGTVSGPTGEYQIGDFSWAFGRAPIEQIDRARACLYDQAEAAGQPRSDQGVANWIEGLSYSDQQSLPQGALDDCEDIPDVTFTITYSPPVEVMSPDLCGETDFGDGTVEVFCQMAGPSICLAPEEHLVPTTNIWGVTLMAVILGVVPCVVFGRRRLVRGLNRASQIAS